MNRFRKAVQILLYLSDASVPLTSAFLGARLQAEPARVRQVFRRLTAAGLIDVRAGPGGGATLARSDGSITLGEVYRAMVKARDGERPGLDQVVAQAVAEAMDRVTLDDVGRNFRRTLDARRKQYPRRSARG